MMLVRYFVFCIPQVSRERTISKHGAGQKTQREFGKNNRTKCKNS